MSQFKLVAGADEAGRGPLIGDVVAAAVILDSNAPIDGIHDSKKLSPKKREYLYYQIQERALAWSIARASVDEIERLNILHASLLAMKRAVNGLTTQPDFVKVDGNRLPNWSYNSEAIVGGDALVAEIGAASILAKVARDIDCLKWDKMYPGYGIAAHKGYPTKQHLAALKTLGPTKLHRKTFSPVKELLIQDALF